MKIYKEKKIYKRKKIEKIVYLYDQIKFKLMVNYYIYYIFIHIELMIIIT